MTATELRAGFADKVLAAQRSFRSLMEAMAHHGSVHQVSAAVGCPAPMMRATAAIALTLFDHDTPIWLDPTMSEASEVARWLNFHSGAPIVADPAASSFAVIGDPRQLPELSRFALGSDEYPDRSTTLIIQVKTVTEGKAYELRGPGIDGVTLLRATIEPLDLFDRLAINAGLFPRGIDIVLVSGEQIVAIPRTTRVSGHGG